MRIRSLSTISLVVLILTYGVVRAVPPLHEAARAWLRKGVGETDFLALAERRPNDEAAWLAACWAASATEQVAPADRERAYARAIALAPRSAAPHWFYAIQLVSGIPLRRAERDAIYESRSAASSETSGQLDSGQKAALARADAALQRAGQLDPTNAAVDYVRTYLALADHNDAAAMALLRSALGKQKWDQYGRTAAIAGFETLRRVVPLTEASTYAADYIAPDVVSIMIEIRVAEVVADMSILAARGGDDARAIFLRQSVGHMGRLMTENEDQIMDAGLGLTAWAIGSRRDPKQPVPSDARDPNDPGHEIHPGAAIASYLRQHGRPDLAAEYLSFGKQLRPTQKRLKQATDPKERRGKQDANLAIILGHLSRAQMSALPLLLLCGIAALLLRAFHRPVRPIEWPPWGWLVVMAACLAVVFVVGLIWPGGSPCDKAFREMWARMGWDPRDLGPGLGERPWGHYFMLIGLPAMLVSALIVVLLHRRRSRDLHAGPVGHYVGTLLAVLLPLAALLSLAVLALAVPSAQRRKTGAAISQAVIYRGEIAYYGIKLP
jgi:hypothetical protein